jgi:hypothetical protein
VSKVFRKSINKQSNFFPSEKYNEISAWSEQILSIVEYPFYCNIFNIVLTSGVIPESWSIGIIPKEPDNYRAITLVDCLKKLFTAIINNRLSLLADEINLISK